MSTVVTMDATVGEFVNGQTYRVRSRFADHREIEGKVTIIDEVPISVSQPIEGE